MATNAYSYTNVTFRLDGDDDYNCQVTRAEFVNTPNINQVATLCGIQGSVGRTTWNFELEGLQNWFSYSSLVAYLNANEGKAASIRITWPSPDGTDSVLAIGIVTLVAAGFGGTADEIATFSVSLPVTGSPTFTRTIGS